MNLFAWEIALACGLLAPAQSAPVPVQPATSTVQHAPQPAYNTVEYYYLYDFSGADPVVLAQAGAAASPRPAVDEEIEVMRALLLRKLGGTARRNTPTWSTNTSAPLAGTVHTYDAQWLQSANRNLASTVSTNSGALAIECAYLDGYGAVLTVTLPSLARHDPSPQASTPAPAPLSDWERTRRQINGETEPAQPAAAPKEQPLGDVLLHLLADNGKHFTHLRDDERLTVTVIFRGAGHTAVRWSNDTDPLTWPATAGSWTGTTAGTTTTGTAGSTTAGSTTSSETQTARDIDLLADLHLKQGQYDQAIAVLEKGIRQLEDQHKDKVNRLGPNHRIVENDVQVIKLLYAKHAQSLLGAGKVEEARDVMEKLRQMGQTMNTSQATAVTAATTKPSSAALPAKLTVSATKKQLDLVGAGKMTFEDFRKEAKLTFYPATGTEKPAVGEKK